MEIRTTPRTVGLATFTEGPAAAGCAAASPEAGSAVLPSEPPQAASATSSSTAMTAGLLARQARRAGVAGGWTGMATILNRTQHGATRPVAAPRQKLGP